MKSLFPQFIYRNLNTYLDRIQDECKQNEVGPPAEHSM